MRGRHSATHPPESPAFGLARASTVIRRKTRIRLRALIVLLWRAGLRISEALALQESDLNSSGGAVLVRRGKGGKRREVGMDRCAWQQLDPWLEVRRELPIGALLCVIPGPTAGRRWDRVPNILLERVRLGAIEQQVDRALTRDLVRDARITTSRVLGRCWHA